VFDIIDRCCERPLFAVNNPLGDLIGWQSSVTPNQTDHWNIDSWKNVGRRFR
jgi:hypothetical protein